MDVRTIENTPKFIRAIDIDRMWHDYQKSTPATPKSFLEKMLPPDLEPISIQSTMATEEKAIKRIFAILSDDDVVMNQCAMVIETVLTDFSRKLIENKEAYDAPSSSSNKSIREEKMIVEITEYTTAIAKLMINELLVNNFDPKHLKFLNKICHNRVVKTTPIPTWKLNLGTTFIKTCRSMIFDDLLSDEVVKKMISNYIDIQYSEDSGETCDINIKIDYNRWNEKLMKIIIIVSRLTKIPSDEYFFVPVVAISAIMKETCRQLNLSSNHKIVFSEIIKKILSYGNKFIANLFKTNNNDFKKIYDLLRESEKSYAESCHDIIMTLL